jgi:hypothetical protein
MRATLLCAVALLAGCASIPAETPEQYAARVRAYWAPECRLAGYPEGTQAFEDCIIARWQESHRQDDAARRAAGLQLLLNNQPRTCTSIVNGAAVTTRCY